MRHHQDDDDDDARDTRKQSKVERVGRVGIQGVGEAKQVCVGTARERVRSREGQGRHGA
jgi:hypothetical protein